jgi:hypothetical protein
MRTTLTLDPDVEKLLQDEVHRARQPLKRVVNEALRRGLAKPVRRKKAFKVVPHVAALRPGYDAARFNALADELDEESMLESLRQPR